MKITKLHVMGSRWYATFVDGNLTIGGFFGAPTNFPASMTRQQVLDAIKQQTPEIDIEVKD